MQRVINLIYWSPNNFFTNGTKLKIDKKDRVSFNNPLMAPGRAIIHWDSSLNYQGNKLVPQLPMLKVGQEYRMVAYLSSTPANTYIIRLIFRDLQGNKIKRIDFRSTTHNFVVPMGTVNYSIEIINSGLYQLDFARLELGPAQLSQELNGDIWVQQPVNPVIQKMPLNIVLMEDGKQARKTHPEIKQLPTLLPIQAISVSWQYSGDLQAWLIAWLKHQQLTNFHLVSAAPRFDHLVTALANKYPQTEILTTGVTRQTTNSSWCYQINSWDTLQLVDVNWQELLPVMRNRWEEVDS